MGRAEVEITKQERENETFFVSSRQKTFKICKKTSKGWFSINRCLKIPINTFNTDIQKRQSFIIIFNFKSKFKEQYDHVS